jgi:hypothetical protein
MADEIIRGSALSFEAVKVSMSQDKNGIILRLNVHPNDCPKELHTDWVGTRYMVAMVRLNDDDTPDDRGYVEIQKLIASAGLLCRNEEFYKYIFDLAITNNMDNVWHTNVPSEMENECIDAMKKICGIKSRTEFRDNEAARKKFEALRNDFMVWKKGWKP